MSASLCWVDVASIHRVATQSDVPVLRIASITQNDTYAAYEDLCDDRLVLLTKKRDDAYHFDDVDALLQAIWALD